MENNKRIALSEFSLNIKTQIHTINNANTSFNYSDGLLAEKNILKSIIETKNISSNSTELMYKASNWPSYYHFSIERSNVLKAIDFPKESKVLELGAGCGAITRYLGETFTRVDAIEGSYMRSTIARKRCRDLDNVNIYCSNFKNINFTNQYDIVFMIGSLEYAPLFFDDTESSSIDSMLAIAKSALKPEGLLVIAIENKIGLKYWSGCQEDHTNSIYEGIHNYPNKPSAVTFSKKEITESLKQQGLTYTGFFSCFPDYKFTSLILNENIENKNLFLHNWIKYPFSSYLSPRENTFNEGLAARTLSRAGLLDEFSNSFLIISSLKPIEEKLSHTDWAAKKFPSIYRKSEYKCLTTLKTQPNLHITKTKDIISTNNTNSDINIIEHHPKTQKWEEGDLLIFSMFEIFYSKDFNTKILQLLDKYYLELLRHYSKNEVDNENYPILKNNSIDFLLRNIIKRKEIYSPIDEEWISTKSISADFVLFRCIKHDICASNNNGLPNRIKNTEKFAINAIKHFFPQYNKKRHDNNHKKEESLQKQIGDNQVLKIFRYTQKYNFIKNKNVWNLLYPLWKLLPDNIKTIIKSTI